MSKFRNYEKKYITAGELMSLEGWWEAANECRVTHTKKNGKPNALAYSVSAGKVAQDNTAGTIEKYVGAVLKAQDMINVKTGKPFKMGDFKGIHHLVATVKGQGQVKVKAKAKPKTNVEKAEAILDTLTGAELRRLFAKYGK